MNITRGWAFCALAALFLTTPACVSQKFKDIEVRAEANPKANFAGYETYAWAAATAMVRDPGGNWTVPEVNVGAEILYLVNRELRGRGMTEVSESPDVLVSYGIGVDMLSMDVVVDPETDAKKLEQVPRGGLTVILTDPASRRLIWIGGAMAKLQDQPSPELVKERLDYAITHMFGKLPR